MTDSVITEEEYDNLPDQTQRVFIFCNKCGFFYNVNIAKSCPACELEKIEREKVKGNV